MQHPTTAREDVTQAACTALARLRETAPRVHCITNAVAQNFTANVLLALGCVPSMTLSAAEVGGFVAGAQALLVNLGTFDAERRQATELAIKAASERKLPWVLDPVFVDRSQPRAEFARALIASGPSVVRLNRGEFAAIAGTNPSPDALAVFAGDNKIVVGLSGETDTVADGQRIACIANGHKLMSRVTAMGCAVSAITAACLAVERDGFVATAAALIMAGVGGEIAGDKAQGPGSFAVGILDALYSLDAAAVAARARVS